MAGLNSNPTLFDVAEERRADQDLEREADPDARDPLDSLEVFEMIRHIKDPEHPHTLEQLRVAKRDLISVDDARGLVKVNFTPTIPHCSMATLIGLCIRVNRHTACSTTFDQQIQRIGLRATQNGWRVIAR